MSGGCHLWGVALAVSQKPRGSGCDCVSERGLVPGAQSPRWGLLSFSGDTKRLCGAPTPSLPGTLSQPNLVSSGTASRGHLPGPAVSTFEPEAPTLALPPRGAPGVGAQGPLPWSPAAPAGSPRWDAP